MRFCDLFISYKIGLKGIKSTIPFTKLPMYRKIAVIATFSTGIFGLIMNMINQQKIALVMIVLALLFIGIFLIIDSTKKNLKAMLQNHYKPYSQSRMNMVLNLLKSYNVDITDNDVIDLLIEEAKQAQLYSDYFAPLKKPLKMLSAIVVPIVVYVAQKIGDAATQDEMIVMALYAVSIIILIFSMIFSMVPIIKEVCYRDYNKYNELISDLKQIKLFYSNGNVPSVFSDSNS